MEKMEWTFGKRLKQLGIKKQVDAAMIVEEAQKTINKALGERGEQNLRVVSYRNGTLKIAATSNAWAAECRQKVRIETGGNIKKVVFIISTQLYNQQD